MQCNIYNNCFSISCSILQHLVLCKAQNVLDVGSSGLFCIIQIQISIIKGFIESKRSVSYSVGTISLLSLTGQAQAPNTFLTPLVKQPYTMA